MCEYTGVVEGAPRAKTCVPRPKSVKCDEMFYSLFFLEVSCTQHLKDATLQDFWSFFLVRKCEGFQSLLFISISTSSLWRMPFY